MFKKFIFPAFLLWIFSCWLSYADFKEDDNGRKIAEQYLESNKNDDFWENNSPRIWEWTPLYMEKSVPSYFEYQVICERNVDCGYIIVNVDWDDVDIPITSPSDIPPSQILTQKSWAKKSDLQFYYFSPFDIYSKNTITNQINAINPQIDPTEGKEILDEMKDEEKQKIRAYIQEKKNQLPTRFKQQWAYIKYLKGTQKFKEIKEKIQKSNVVGVPGFEDNEETNWRYVKWESSWNCNSRVPCYKQYDYEYGIPWFTKICPSGCSPVAAAIIFWYHDRVENYPELIPNTQANDENGKLIPWRIFLMIRSIRNYMNTECTNNIYDNVYATGSTIAENMPAWIQFAHDKWYENSTSGLILEEEELFLTITNEIDNGNPILVNIFSWYLDFTEEELIIGKSGHTVVWYGYNKDTTDDSLKEIRINAGWGNGLHSNTNINTANITNFDVAPENTFEFSTILDSVVWFHIEE